MNKKLVSQLYLNEGKSREEVAKILGVSYQKLCYFLFKNSLVRNERNFVESEEPKICTKCKQVKKSHDFYFQSYKRLLTHKSREGSWCKMCMKQQVVDRQRKYKQSAVDYKGGCCTICGFNLYIGALEFHHIDPSKKDFEVSTFYKKPLLN